MACTFLVLSCKKDNYLQTTTASPEQLAAENNKLAGTWSAVGIPSNSFYPYNGSIVFDGQALAKLTDYADNELQRPYTLTGSADTYFLNINTTDYIKRSKILKLTADTLKLLSTISGADTTNKIVFNEAFVKANIDEVNNNIFKIYITPFTGGTALYYGLNVNIKIYVTAKGGTEQLVESKNAVTQPYTYTYTPVIGDHIRIAITNVVNTGGPPVLTCLATYKGTPYGKDWQSALLSSLPDKGWDINN